MRYQLSENVIALYWISMYTARKRLITAWLTCAYICVQQDILRAIISSILVIIPHVRPINFVVIYTYIIYVYTNFDWHVYTRLSQSDANSRARVSRLHKPLGSFWFSLVARRRSKKNKTERMTRTARNATTTAWCHCCFILLLCVALTGIFRKANASALLFFNFSELYFRPSVLECWKICYLHYVFKLLNQRRNYNFSLMKSIIFCQPKTV